MFKVFVLVALYFAGATNGQTVQEVIFDECGCGSGQFTSTGPALISGSFTTPRNRCGDIGEDGFAKDTGLRVPLDRTLTIPESTTGGISWGIMFGFESKPAVPIVTLATITPANGEPFSFVLGTNRARITGLVTANLEDDLDSYRIMFGFFRDTPVIAVTSARQNLFFQGPPISQLGQATVQINGFNTAVVKDVLVVRDWFFGPSINNLLQRPVPVRAIPEVRDLKQDRGFRGFQNRDVAVDLKRMLRFNSNTDDLVWSVAPVPRELGIVLNFDSAQGTFIFKPARSFVGQIPLSVEFGFRGRSCRKNFDVNILVVGFNGALTLQEVIFDQCGCQNNEFSSRGPQFIEGRLRMTSDNCGPRGSNRFPIQGGLRVPLEPLFIPVETATADWGILFGFDEVPSSLITVATLTQRNGGRSISFQVDGRRATMTGIMSQTFLPREGPFRVFFGFQRNTPTIGVGNVDSVFNAILASALEPLGEIDIVISGNSNVIVKDMIVAVNIGTAVRPIIDLVKRPVPQDIPAVNFNSLVLPVKQDVISVEVDLNQGIVQSNTENLVWRISEANEFGEYKSLDSEEGSVVFTPNPQFFAAATRSFSAEVGLEENQCRNSVQFSFAIEGVDDDESTSDVFLFAGVGVGVVVIGVLWTIALVTVRKRRENNPEKKIKAMKENLEKGVREDVWDERL